MGSWIGRIAARYRMRTLEFAADWGVQAPLCATNVGWLLAAPIPELVIKKWAYLARIDPEQLKRIQTPDPWLIPRKRVAYCGRCLFLNRADVTAPRWKREWFDPDASNCAEHREPLRHLAAGKLNKCGNFGNVIRVVSLHDTSIN